MAGAASPSIVLQASSISISANRITGFITHHHNLFIRSSSSASPARSGRRRRRSGVVVAAASTPPDLPLLSLQELPLINQRIRDIMQRQSQLLLAVAADDRKRAALLDPRVAEQAYERCRKICAEYSKTFYLGTLLMPREQQRAAWAIYAWGRRTDDLVDGPDGVDVGAVDEWEERLEDIFRGKLVEDDDHLLDAALAHTISNYHLDIQPFKDVIQGMRMDLYQNRFPNFEELCLYSYYVSGAPCLMILPVFGIPTQSPFQADSVTNAIIHATIATQLTNILRDVGEDASRGRIYIPQDELAEFGLSDEDVMSRKVSDRWREFMKEQIKRARYYYLLAQHHSSQFHHKPTRFTIVSTLMMYSMILDEIEHNGYDNFSKRAQVGITKKLVKLPLALLRAL